MQTKPILVVLSCSLLLGLVLATADAGARPHPAWTLVAPLGDHGLDGAAQLLEKEIKVRTPRLDLSRAEMLRPATPAIVLGTPASSPNLLKAMPAGLVLPTAPEGYAIWSAEDSGARRVYGIGADARGVLYAAAHLLRAMDFERPDLTLPAIAPFASAPAVALRGHQLGYGNMNNTIDAWDLDTFDQYIRDLIVFGTNAIELSPTIKPDAKESVHMKSTMWDMNIALSKVIHGYGLEVWLWMAVEGDLADPVVAAETKEGWTRLFAAMPHIDHVFVAGGDPGSNEPGRLMNWLGEVAPALRGPHPEAGFWVSNQGFEAEENDTFFAYLQENKPEWFAGAAFGPWAKIGLREMRERTPAQYPIRRYPDLTHSVRCQYPVPDWDPAFAHTLGRESFNARPAAMKQIHGEFMPYALGFVAYSEGVHDDVNKALWSRFGWNPEVDPAEVLADYGRYFIGREHGEAVAKGLLGLEANWVGPIEANTSIAPTAALWKDLAARDEERLSKNWRFQMIYLRALYDDYVQKRAGAETAREKQAVNTLRSAVGQDLDRALAGARVALAESGKHPDLRDLRTQLDGFGPALFKLIGIQLDVKRFGAMNPERGAVLEFLDTPLNNRDWWLAELDRVQSERKAGTLDEASARARILALCAWDQAPEGGFYDDLGHVGLQPHLVRDNAWEQDPGGVSTAMVEFMRPAAGWRLSWADQAQTLFGTPLKMRYEGLDPAKSYTLRATYTGRFKATMKLTADGTHEVHGPLAQSNPIAPVEFALPRELTRDGTLELQWDLVNGRGCQVAEVWLIPAE